MNHLIPDTERGRVARLLQATEAEARTNAVAKARLFYTPPCCGGKRSESSTVPSESVLLTNRLLQCKPLIRQGCVSESVRIAQVQQCTLDRAINPLNPETRFSEFRGPFVPTVCPPVPQEFLNANVPKSQLKNCPLPNKPDNPVLPG
jgi:hypothetical protein